MAAFKTSAGISSYAKWISRHHRLVLGVALIMAIVSGALALRLPVLFNVKNLLPASQSSVQNLEILQKRARAFGTVYVLIEAEDPELRAAGAQLLQQEIEKIDPSLLANVAYDDSAIRSFYWEHRFLFVGLDELTDARNALHDKINGGKLAANPLYISLEEPSDRDVDDRMEKLRARLNDAESNAKQPHRFVSKDEKLQFMILRTSFSSSDLKKGAELIRIIEGAMKDANKQLGNNVSFGIAGPVTATLYEQKSILRGMVIAAFVTIVLVSIALILYYRSILMVLASLWSLAVGVSATFAFTKIAIGHLNLMTAFLAAIVVGNGINSGLILLARYSEELRAGRKGSEALANAMSGAARGTLAAALTASVAYGSLIVTDFRGFRHFGLIAGVGMVLCWLSAFVVLPAGLAFLEKRGWIRVHKAPAIGRWLARLAPSQTPVLILSVLVTLVCAVTTYRYLADDPFLKDWRVLRPSSALLRQARALEKKLRNEFDPRIFSGQTSKIVMGVDHPDVARDLAKRIRDEDGARPEEEKLFAAIRGMYDFLPSDQEEKLALLTDIRTMLNDDITDEFSAEELEELEFVRPPEDLAVMSIDDIPPALAWPFIEKDGSKGKLILLTGHPRFKTWNVQNRVEFAESVRALELPQGAVVGGQSFVVADIIETMERDAPLAIIVALVGAVFVVWLVVGLRRHGLVTLACGASGILAMIALCATFGLKVHFIDLIALPITIGIGIDYAVNLAARDRGHELQGPRDLLATTGGAVLLCSFTTIVGYGSLLLSENGGIRSFGFASILGEFACVTAALLLAPILLHLKTPRRYLS
ncbi:MAG: MMPL family transporter [Myxococcales bacterium]|nr:MMPL family transporter [Myxococcales bacterium]